MSSGFVLKSDRNFSYASWTFLHKYKGDQSMAFSLSLKTSLFWLCCAYKLFLFVIFLYKLLWNGYLHR